MGREVGFRVEGLTATVRALQSLGLDVDDLKGAFSEIARQAVPVYQRHAPVRTGRLRGDFRGNRAKSKAVVTVGRARVPYAAPVNWGWAARGIAPSNFVAKGDAEMQPRAVRLLEDEINKAARRRGLK